MPKRRRRKLKPAPILVLLLAASVVAGLDASPITSLSRARVVGAEPFDRPKIEGIMSSLAGKPIGQVDTRLVESGALESPEVAKAEYRQNLFGRSELKLSYRKPVARMEGRPNELFDEDGVLYSSRQATGVLPLLRLPEDSLGPKLTFADGWPKGRVAYLCSHIPKEIARDSLVVEVQERGGLCLNMGQQQQIVLGSEDQLDEKIAKLESLLEGNPRLLAEIKELNLTAPSRPVFRASQKGQQ